MAKAKRTRRSPDAPSADATVLAGPIVQDALLPAAAFDASVLPALVASDPREGTVKRETGNGKHLAVIDLERPGPGEALVLAEPTAMVRGGASAPVPGRPPEPAAQPGFGSQLFGLLAMPLVLTLAVVSVPAAWLLNTGGPRRS